MDLHAVDILGGLRLLANGTLFARQPLAIAEVSHAKCESGEAE